MTYEMVSRFTCDRCAAGFERPVTSEERSFLATAPDRPVSWSSHHFARGRTQHLCESCTADFVAWVDAGRQPAEASE